MFPFQHLGNRRVCQAFKTAFAVVVIDRQLAAFCSADNQVFPAIAIYIGPRHTWPELAQFSRQQRLPLKVIEVVLLMRVAEELADIFQQRPRFPFDGAGSAGIPAGSLGFINFINPIGFDPIDEASLAVAPYHFNRHAIRHFSCPKNCQRIRTRHIPAT